jgi:beta-galactosidase
VGWYGDGRVAAVDHNFGKGKTRLIGTMIGSGYYTHPGKKVAFFARLLYFTAVISG